MMVAADSDVVRRLRAGDQAAFRDLVTAHHGGMIRLAQSFVSSRAVAEEVVQDTWLAVIKGIDRFEGRSSLLTWIYRILTNQARDRGARDAKVVPESSLGAELDNDGPSLGVERFVGKHGRGMWAQPLSRWSDLPDERLAVRETFDLLHRTISQLPPNQRRVLILRDVEGWASEEVRELLDISEVNQRVLLHRARSFVRTALEREFAEAGDLR